MALENIIVIESDLEKLQPNILDMKFGESANLDDIIAECKRMIYTHIKADYIANYRLDNPTFGTSDEIDSALAKVKDYPIEENIKNKVIRKAIAYIYRQNIDYTAAEVWDQEANIIPLKYYIDEDDSGTAGYDEEVTAKRFPSFHR